MARGSNPPALTLTLERARAHWHREQGLAEPLKASLEEVVAATVRERAELVKAM